MCIGNGGCVCRDCEWGERRKVKKVILGLIEFNHPKGWSCL